MTDPLPSHHCPGCGAQLRAVSRYPWHFCRSCLALARDGAGRELVFTNASFSGGFAWRFTHETDRRFRPCRGAICLIRGRAVIVHEARFGGIVAEPLASPFATIPGYWRLTREVPAPPPDARGGGIG